MPFRSENSFLCAYVIVLFGSFCMGGLAVHWWHRPAADATGVFLTVTGIMVGFMFSILMGVKFAEEYKVFRGVVATTKNAVITTDCYGTITVFNRVAEEIFQIDRKAVLGRNYRQVFTGRASHNTVGLHVSLDNVLKYGEGSCNREIFYTAPDGWEMVLTVDTLPYADGSTSGALLVARDITVRKVIEQRLYDLTMRDGLTNLYNHGHLHKTLKNELKWCAEQGKPLAFILLDIDNFKFYNDRFGHPAGDELLKEFSRLLLKSVRPGDTVGRYGGDEFGIILPGASMEVAEQIGERLRRRISEYSFANTGEMPGGCLTASLGIAMYPQHGGSVHELVKMADEAMYHAKRNNKNRVQFFFSSIEKFQQELNGSENDIMLTLKALLMMVNGKDRYTFAHCEKVAEYAAIIATELKMQPEQVKAVKLAGFLHDIGKLEVPGEILIKEGPLNDEEMDNIRQHPWWGINILRSFQGFNKILPAILYHHERYDGNGYPEGLAGENIPLFARIINIADSFDAMVSHRPYKRNLSLEEAIHELEKNAGSQFDPALAGIFVNALKAQGEGIFSLKVDLAG